MREVSPRLLAAVAEYIKISKEQEAQQSAILQAMGGKPPTPLQIAENSYTPHDLAAALVFMRKKFASIHPEGAALADDILCCVYLTGGAGPEFQCACVPVEWVICTGEVTRVAKRQLAEFIPVLGAVLRDGDPNAVIKRIHEVAAAHRPLAIELVKAEADAYGFAGSFAELREAAKRPGMSAALAMAARDALIAMPAAAVPASRPGWLYRLRKWIGRIGSVK